PSAGANQAGAAAPHGLVTLPSRTRNALAGLAALVGRLRTRIGVLPLPELLDEVLEASGYRAMLADGSEDGEERWANLLELREVTTRYDDLSPEDALDRLLEETALVADQDSYEGDADAVTLITLHAAKGLEFPVDRRRASRFGAPITAGGGAWREGSGRPGAPAEGTFQPSRDLAARREAFAAGARSGHLAQTLPAWDEGSDVDAEDATRSAAARPAPRPPRTVIPG